MYGDEELALRQIPLERPAIVILDAGCPGFQISVFLRRLKAVAPQTRVLILTGAATCDAVFESLAAGADGIVTPGVMDLSRHGEKSSVSFVALSARELQIARLWSQGAADKQIAAGLSISIESVRTHAKRISSKLSVHTRTEACRKLWESGQN